MAAFRIMQSLITGCRESLTSTCVHKVKNGVFRVHPRQGRLSAAVIGPFSGRAPSGMVATAQTTYASASSVRFHVSTWRSDIDNCTVAARLGEKGARFLNVLPWHPGFLISTDEPGFDRPAVTTPTWNLVLSTIADPPEEIAFAWAEFSDVVLVFPTDTDSEVRLLS